MLVSSYNSVYALFSFAVAILASYTALDMTGRVTRTEGKASALWLAGGSSAMGTGIWSMHFIGMLAFQLPFKVGYDLTLTGLSLLIAIASSAFALWLACQTEMPLPRLLLGAVLMGIGIASMHYVGMAALLMNPVVEYVPSLFALSVLIAILASGVALWIAFRLRGEGQYINRTRIGASALLGWVATMTLGLGPDASSITVAVILLGCAMLSVTIFCGYAIVFSTAPMIRGYRKARRWIEGALAVVYGAAAIKLLSRN